MQAILGKKRKVRTSTDGISSPQNVSKRSHNKDIPGTAAKKEDQLKYFVAIRIFLFQKKVSCNKLGDTISTIDFEVTTDSPHVDSSIATYKHVDLLISFFLYCIEISYFIVIE